jgi:uncharacterized coiled-coil protein SlyX
VTLGGAFSDTIIQIAATVSAGVLIACVIAAVRFTMHVRDSVKKQDEVLEHIGKAVNHVPPGEPRLYDLVAEVSDQAAEAAQSAAEAARTMRIMRGTVEQHLHDDEERFARQDVVLDEVRGVVLDLRDKGEVNAAALDSINDKVIDLSVTVEGLTAE